MRSIILWLLSAWVVSAGIFGGGDGVSGKDYYSLLAVPRTSTQKEISKAYRKLARKHHPDRFKKKADKERARKRMLQVNKAHDILSDEEMRKRYDELLDRGVRDWNDEAWNTLTQIKEEQYYQRAGKARDYFVSDNQVGLNLAIWGGVFGLVASFVPLIYVIRRNKREAEETKAKSKKKMLNKISKLKRKNDQRILSERKAKAQVKVQDTKKGK